MLTFTVGSGPALQVAESADFDTGQAVYRVTGIGTFTFGWDQDHSPEADQPPAEERLQVTYGVGQFGPHMAEAPVVYGVTLSGAESFTRTALTAGTLRLRPYRLFISAPVRVSKTAARRTTAIVSALAKHWLAAPWTPALRRAHEHHRAPHALSWYSVRIAEHEELMRCLREERAAYVRRADQAVAVLQSGPVRPPEGAPPHPFTLVDTAGR
ncbi:hypothetical protein OK074_2078 [Actinobacteria bacterium OK074]|nr:hypothetical protein OK074_2078 [Actinobacteria bacterium OK074]